MLHMLAGTTSAQLITSADVCAELNINRSTLSRWVGSGRITPALKLPGIRGAFMFTTDEVARVRAIGTTSPSGGAS